MYTELFSNFRILVLFFIGKGHSLHEDDLQGNIILDPDMYENLPVSPNLPDDEKQSFLKWIGDSRKFLKIVHEMARQAILEDEKIESLDKLNVNLVYYKLAHSSALRKEEKDALTKVTDNYLRYINTPGTLRDYVEGIYFPLSKYQIIGKITNNLEKIRVKSEDRPDVLRWIATLRSDEYARKYGLKELLESFGMKKYTKKFDS